MTTPYNEQRFWRVLEYLQSHSHHAPSLMQAADMACLSPHHWHRVFRKAVGVTQFDAQKIWRLHRAGVLLVSTHKPVREIALACGYSGNVQSFVRIFRNAYGVSPSRFRALSRLPYAPIAPCHQEEEMYSIEIKEIKPIPVASLPHQGDYMEIGNTVTKLESTLTLRGHLPSDSARYCAVFFDNAAETPTDQLRSLACTFIGGALQEAPLENTEIAGGRYAVLRHVGAYANLHQAYQWFFNEWLPASGIELDNSRPCFEEYLNDWKNVPAHELLTDIHIAVV